MSVKVTIEFHKIVGSPTRNHCFNRLLPLILDLTPPTVKILKLSLSCYFNRFLKIQNFPETIYVETVYANIRTCLVALRYSPDRRGCIVKKDLKESFMYGVHII